MDGRTVTDRTGTVARPDTGREFGDGRTGHVVAGPGAGRERGGSAEPGGVIEVRLRAFLAARGMTLAELSHQVGVTTVNLSVLKNGHARAIRFSTLARLCEALDCQPGDLLAWCATLNADRDRPRSAAEAEAAGGGAEAG